MHASRISAPGRLLAGSSATPLLLVLLLLRPLVASASTYDHVILITLDGVAGFYLSDPQASLPTLRRMAAEGAVAEALRVSNPSTTWPNHTSLVTGMHPADHGVLFNGRLSRGGPGEALELDPACDQRALVAVPTLYDCLHRQGYRTAAINWPATRGATSLDDNFPDAPDRLGQTTPRLRAELVHAGILDDTTDASFAKRSVAAHDQAWNAAAQHVLRAHRPHLLLVHLLGTDVIQHRYGPQSQAAYTALALADAQVAELLRAVEAAGLRERTTVLVASDHGFAKPSKLIYPNVVLRKAGLLRPSPRRRAQCVSEGGTALVYLANPSTAREDRARVLALLGGVEGIARITEPGAYAALHLPDPARNPQMGDLLLVAADGYVFADESLEDEVITPLPMSLGSHGYLNTDPRMKGFLVAWGRGIKAGTKLGMVDIIDVAPTMAALLGEELPGARGRVLREMLGHGR